jgi:hypothetical protein
MAFGNYFFRSQNKPKYLNNTLSRNFTFLQLLRRLEYGRIEKYMGGPMIYVISSRGIHHVMRTFLFECTVQYSTILVRKTPVYCN